MNDSKIKRCPSCRRSKAKAIKEQLSKKEPCGVPEKDCYFYDEIKHAIENIKSIKAIKKEKKKTSIRIEKKVKTKINIFKK